LHQAGLNQLKTKFASCWSSITNYTNDGRIDIHQNQIKISVIYTCCPSANSAASFGLCSLYS